MREASRRATLRRHRERHGRAAHRVDSRRGRRLRRPSAARRPEERRLRRPRKAASLPRAAPSRLPGNSNLARALPRHRRVVARPPQAADMTGSLCRSPGTCTRHRAKRPPRGHAYPSRCTGTNCRSGPRCFRTSSCLPWKARCRTRRRRAMRSRAPPNHGSLCSSSSARSSNMWAVSPSERAERTARQISGSRPIEGPSTRLGLAPLATSDLVTRLTTSRAGSPSTRGHDVNALGPGGIRSLDQELYADFGELRRERGTTDAAIESWVGQITAERLAAPFRFVRRGAPSEVPL